MMQNSKRISGLNLSANIFIALFASVILFSCTKDRADVQVMENEEFAAANGSAPKNSNGMLTIPYSKTVFVPCANGGAGENVSVTGNIHVVYQMTWTDQAFTLVYHDNLANATAVGLTSGETFVASGGTQGTVYGPWFSNQWVGSTVRKLRLVGPNTQFSINYKMKFIITPDGEVRVDVEEETVDCQTI